MPEVTFSQAFELALQHHCAGKLAEAEALYRQILAVEPNHAGTLHLLGVVAHQTGRHEIALEAICHAIRLKANNAGAHAHLGEVYRAIGRIDEAIASFRRALELDPKLAEAHNNLGVALAGQGHRDEAMASYRRALELQPDFPAAHNNLGNVLQTRGQLEEAVASYLRALDLKPDYAEAHNNLGSAYRKQGQAEKAIEACRRAIDLKPGYAEAYNNLGSALREVGQLDEAFAAYHRALEFRPDNREAQYNLGNALRDAGRLDEAIAAYRCAVELAPGHAEIQSTLILALHLHPGLDRNEIFEEYQRWNRLVGEPLKHVLAPHPDNRDPERRLRIGYVSPDFRNQVVGLNLRPLFQYQDHQNFEIVCYSGVLQPDSLTEGFRQCAHHWRNVAGLTDDALAAVIRQDGVDILVDLSQHATGNRLPVFARRPAPVQVSFAGYPESTGLEAIGYRISDRYLEAGASEFPSAGSGQAPNRSSEIGSARPPDLPSSISHSEPALNLSKGPAERVFLLDSFWCYDPSGVEIGVNELPARENSSLTFGSLNSFSKVNEPVLRFWARVLGKVKDSRLVLLCGFGSHRKRTLDSLQREGVEAQRVEFVEPRPRGEYLKLYRRLDLVLDTFPYNGHTSSLDALWMGVPVVSLAGRQAVSRAGLSQLSNLGLPDLVSSSEDESVRIAVELAHDLPRLAQLRATLRARMAGSVLMDARLFARQIEAAYRAMWRDWCANQP